MQTNLTTTQSASALKPDAAQRLEQARQRIRFAQRGVAINEGRLLDFETAEEISCALNAVVRDLEQIMLQVAVMERRAR